VNETSADATAVDMLIGRAFGPGRLAKTAERLREGATQRFDLSFVAWDKARAVGCVRVWPIRIGATPALLLGPFAVDPALHSQGLGARLMTRACRAVDDGGEGPILLVGDEPYYAPFGFVAAPTVFLPGPVDQRRVLVRSAAKRGQGDRAALGGMVAGAGAGL
jgi:predicted N-acetyltransferase YhbS